VRPAVVAPYRGAVQYLIAIGVANYLGFERHERLDLESQLAAIVDLKAGELLNWRKERLGDGRLLFPNPAFAGLVRRFLSSPGDLEAQRQLKDWLGGFTTAYGYDLVRLIDAEGATRLSVPEGARPPEPETRRMAAAISIGKSGIADFGFPRRGAHDC